MIHICAPRAPIRCHALTTLRASRRRMAQHDSYSMDSTLHGTDEVIIHRLRVDGLMKHQHVGLSRNWVVVGNHACDGWAFNSAKG